jgi:hypothetical protein
LLIAFALYVFPFPTNLHPCHTSHFVVCCRCCACLPACQNFVSSYKANQNNIPEAWADAYRRTDIQVGENKILYSGTTTVTALIRKKSDERWLHVANVGDARAVLAYGLPSTPLLSLLSIFSIRTQLDVGVIFLFFIFYFLFSCF